jgi:nickel superoxide dismutase
MRRIVMVCGSVLAFLLPTQHASGHCEIPCGIYGDEMRLQMIEEHAATVERAMEMIINLSTEEDRNYNQMVRWIVNKEEHADYIQDIVCQYFMTQRVKPVDEGDEVAYLEYVRRITLLHQILIHAMKAKQTTDLNAVAELKSSLSQFRLAYFGVD